jgi:hypothetical protein
VAWFRIKEPEPKIASAHDNPLAAELQADPPRDAPAQREMENA